MQQVCLWSFQTPFIYTRGNVAVRISVFLFFWVLTFMLLYAFSVDQVPSYSNAFFCWRHGMIFYAFSVVKCKYSLVSNTFDDWSKVKRCGFSCWTQPATSETVKPTLKHSSASPKVLSTLHISLYLDKYTTYKWGWPIYESQTHSKSSKYSLLRSNWKLELDQVPSCFRIA